MSPNEAALRSYLKGRFGSYDDDIHKDDSLEGIVDSMGLFELVEFIEGEFKVRIPNHEFSPQKFSTISSILTVIDEFRTDA